MGIKFADRIRVANLPILKKRDYPGFALSANLITWAVKSGRDRVNQRDGIEEGGEIWNKKEIQPTKVALELVQVPWAREGRWPLVDGKPSSVSQH